jgi:4,5-DOPA dioxygenase extradiol
VQWDQPNAAFPWAERFDDAVAEQLANAPGDILNVTQHPDFALAVPTPDHFIPLLYIAALAAEEGVAADALVRGYTMGSVSMTCYGVGVTKEHGEDTAGAAELPRDVPPDQTNM